MPTPKKDKKLLRYIEIDCKRIKLYQKTITGKELHGLSKMDEGYVVFQEVDGDDPDIQLSAETVVKLGVKDKRCRFYTCPPATFGATKAA